MKTLAWIFFFLAAAAGLIAWHLTTHPVISIGIFIFCWLFGDIILRVIRKIKRNHRARSFIQKQ